MGLRRRTVPGGKGRQIDPTIFIFSIDLEPALFDQNLSFGLKIKALYFASPNGDIIFGGRIKDGDKTPGNHVVNFVFVRIQLAFVVTGRDDGEVVADLGIIEDAPVGFDPILGENFLRMLSHFAIEGFQGSFTHSWIIFGQRP